MDYDIEDEKEVPLSKYEAFGVIAEVVVWIAAVLVVTGLLTIL